MEKVYENLTNEEKENGLYNERLVIEIQNTCLKYCNYPTLENHLIYYDDENLRMLYRKLEISDIVINKLDAIKEELAEANKEEKISIKSDIECTAENKLNNIKIVDAYIKIANSEINYLKNKVKQDIDDYKNEIKYLRQRLKIVESRGLYDDEKTMERKVSKDIFETATAECRKFFENIAERIITSSCKMKKRLTKKEKSFVMGQAITEFLTNFQEQEDNIDYTRIGQKFMELFAEKEQEFKLKD